MAKSDDDFKFDAEAEDSLDASETAFDAPEVSQDAAEATVTVSLPDGVARVSTAVGTFSDGDSVTVAQAALVDEALAYVAASQAAA